MKIGKIVRRFFRGSEDDPPWVRPALLGLLAVTAGLYLWDLGASGWANAYYSAAVQAMTKSWKAFLFGSFDSSSFITVDKTPASLWVMAISARLFGVNAWSILVPQALAGVASVGLLFAAVRRWAGPAAGLIAGVALALTPVAALMFRFNNPDALLVLLLVGAAYATIRAVEKGSTWWLVLAGVLVGGGFMTKMLQAFLIIPVLVLVYAVAGKPRLRRRLVQIALAAVAVVVSSGWWVALVELWPKASRPYIGGSQANSIVELIFGYNGLGRLSGNETGSVVGGGGTGSAGQWGATGITRLFQSDWGGQIAWLIPAAIILGIACLWVAGRAPRTDKTRAAVLLWGGWFVVTAAVFSFSAGIIHQYYAVALAPAIGALVGTGAVALWRLRGKLWSRLTLAVTLVVTSVWAFVLLERSADWYPALRFVILACGLAAALLLALTPLRRHRLAVIMASVGLAAALAGPAAYALQTVATPHSGSIVTAGPSTGSSGFGGGGQRGGQGGTPPSFATQQATGQAATTTTAATGPPALPAGRTGGTSPNAGDGTGGFAGGGGVGGLLNASTPSSALKKLLETNADQYDWVAATVGAQSAAGIQLATGEPVMAIGGFNGSDPAPTLAEFQALVKAGRIHYYIGGQSGGAGSSGSSSQIAQWVAQNYTSSTVGGTTVYDLTSAK